VSNVDAAPRTWQYLTLERTDAVCVLTLSRPEKLNALNHALLTELVVAGNTLQADRSLRVVIVTGAGEKAFVAGADIGELAVLDTRGAEAASAFGSRVFRKLETGPQTVIAAVNGFALGGGCELALACHIRLAAENAKFGLPEVGLGIIPGYGGTQRLPRLVGLGMASEMIATGRMVGAEEALKIGLVNRVVPQAQLLADAKAMAVQIAANAPLAVAAALEAARRSLDTDLDQGLRFESTLFGILGSTKDMHDGLSAFVEKKKATFEGR